MNRNKDRPRGQSRNSGAGSRQMEQQTGGGSYQQGDDVSFDSDREDIDFQQEQRSDRSRQPENRQREQDRGGQSRDNNRSGSDSNR